ncbi:MAG: prolyl oligopeptidase family serine peptidase [Alphaproteobacteria bacterium]|nr:prolyl oligopeptidase family serine peptidase [Alphaproteobacteria bacterium]
MRTLALALVLAPACVGPVPFGADAPKDGGVDTDAGDTGTDGPGDDLPSDTDAPVAPDETDTAGDDTDGPGDSADSADSGTASCACDDLDPCTLDVCLPGGTCAHHGAWDGTPVGLFPQDLLRDPGTLEVQVLSTKTVTKNLRQVRVQELRFTGWESEACMLRPVRLQAFLAMPVDVVGTTRSTPGLVVAHGLGGLADEGAAVGPAGDHGLVTLAYSGPGQGASQGTPSEPDHLFDTLTIPRDSWFWEHAAAAMRGLTLLGALPEVDPGRLAMSGYSGGGVATLIANGVDDRLAAAVVVSATGHWQLAVDNPTPGWQADLLADMTPPRTKDAPEWKALEGALDPRHFLATAHGRTLLIDGTQDQFFPIDTARATMADLQAADPAHRLLEIVDWDHGWFALFNDELPGLESSRAVRFWLRHALGTAGSAAGLPSQPELVDAQPALCDGFTVPCTVVVVRVPPGPYAAVDGWVRFSADGLGWASAKLQGGPEIFTAEIKPCLSLPCTITLANHAMVVDVAFRWGGVLDEPFRLSSIPRLPPGFAPRILPIQP